MGGLVKSFQSGQVPSIGHLVGSLSRSLERHANIKIDLNMSTQQAKLVAIRPTFPTSLPKSVPTKCEPSEQPSIISQNIIQNKTSVPMTSTTSMTPSSSTFTITSASISPIGGFTSTLTSSNSQRIEPMSDSQFENLLSETKASNNQE